MQIDLSDDSGCIEVVRIVTPDGLKEWSSFPGQLTVTDELRGCSYCDKDASALVSVQRGRSCIKIVRQPKAADSTSYR